MPKVSDNFAELTLLRAFETETTPVKLRIKGKHFSQVRVLGTRLGQHMVVQEDLSLVHAVATTEKYRCHKRRITVKFHKGVESRVAKQLSQFPAVCVEIYSLLLIR